MKGARCSKKNGPFDNCEIFLFTIFTYKAFLQEVFETRDCADRERQLTTTTFQIVNPDWRDKVLWATADCSTRTKRNDNSGKRRFRQTQHLLNSTGQRMFTILARSRKKQQIDLRPPDVDGVFKIFGIRNQVRSDPV